MLKSKKIITLLISSVLLFNVTANADSAKTPFTDVEKGSWYESAVASAYENRLIELRRQHDAKEITSGQYIFERAKALRIYTAGMALEKYRMNQITLEELVKNINLTLKGKINHD